MPVKYRRRRSGRALPGSRLPSPETLDVWPNAATDDFRFAVKASRYITHLKKRKDPQSSIATSFGHIDRLGDMLEQVLFQLPPRWRVNVEHPSVFLDALPDGYRYTFEFCDCSWWYPVATDLLATHGAASCLFDLNGQTNPFVETEDFSTCGGTGRMDRIGVATATRSCGYWLSVAGDGWIRAGMFKSSSTTMPRRWHRGMRRDCKDC